MKVYVVLESSGSSEYEYCGVYATKEQAENRIKEIQEITIKELNLYVEEIDLLSSQVTRYGDWIKPRL